MDSPIYPGTTHQRFFQLVGLIRHEYWLHAEEPDQWGLRADPDTLTIQAKKQKDHGMDCSLEVTDSMLKGDLGALARWFYTEICGGSTRLSRQ